MAKRGVKPRLKSIIPLDQDWTPPAHLSELARVEFEHVADLLRQRGTLEQTDSRLVLRRAELCEMADTAYRQLQADGLVIESDRENLSAHPAVKIHSQATALIARIDADLRLTPGTAKASTSVQPGYGAWTAKLRRPS